MELLIGCKREKQINYAPIPITPVPALLVQDVTEPEGCYHFEYDAAARLINSF